MLNLPPGAFYAHRQSRSRRWNMLFPQFTKMAIADQFFVLFVPHGPNVTRAAPVQSAGTTMMSRMFPAPVTIRRERQNARQQAHQIVGGPEFEIRTVSAIMKNDEHAHE